MTWELVRLPVTLTLIGPILTAGDTHSSWGLDITFYRDWQGSLALPGSHIRGKLREAMKDIHDIRATRNRSVDEWFGRESKDKEDQARSYLPHRGHLKVSDFVFDGSLAGADTGDFRTRIRIDPEIGVVDKGALIISEEPFKPGEETAWKGNVEFFAANGDQEKYLNDIKEAFHFITAIGADKTAGYGRLEKVDFAEPVTTGLDQGKTQNGDLNGLCLAIAPQEPLIIGGIRQTDNIFESEKIIPGSVLKGAIAVGLNRISGKPDLNAYIDENNSHVKEICPQLSKRFTDLHFLHAVPAEDMFARPEAIPLSLVKYGDTEEDIAFAEPDQIYARDSTPVSFQVDWKHDPDAPRFPELEYHAVTRTAIDSEMRKADEARLYSFRMIKPTIIKRKDDGSNESKQVYWNSEIRFPKSITSQERQELTLELERVLSLALRYLGKRQGIVIPHNKPLPPISSCGQNNEVDFAIVLQTPAIMIDPQEVAEASEGKIFFDDHKQIEKHYTNYWNDIFGKTATLKTFFASQELKGGYLGMRFMKGHYKPFYLTSSGSTFVFTVDGNDSIETEKVWEIVNGLFENGLGLPKWTKELYGETIWKQCPFVPENGYGEIKVKTP